MTDIDHRKTEDRKKHAEERQAEDKKRLAAEREAREKAREEHEKTRGRPTPTQEEADLAALGHHVELSPDGSPPEKDKEKTREAASTHSGNYATRQSTAKPAAASSS
jgi:hypothetical protein